MSLHAVPIWQVDPKGQWVRTFWEADIDEVMVPKHNLTSVRDLRAVLEKHLGYLKSFKLCKGNANVDVLVNMSQGFA